MDDTTHKPGAGFSKKVLASAVGLTVVATLGLTLTLSNLFGGNSNLTPSTHASQQAPVTDDAPAHNTEDNTDPRNGDASVCGLEAVEMTGEVKLAPQTTWTLPGTTAAPFVEHHGPGVIEDDGYRYCYSRTPTGALLAAANIFPMSEIEPSIRGKMDAKSTVPGPSREAALSTPDERDRQNSHIRIQIAGFRVLSYDGDSAQVDIALNRNTGQMSSQIVALQWAEGDWKVELTPKAEHLNQPESIDSLIGYVSWSGA